MSTILVTGASGFIGSSLAVSLAQHHDVVCMSRHDPHLGLCFVQGTFSSFEDLRKLDDRRIDVVVHLAAVTGGCPERDGMLVNVEGSRCLIRYLIDRGCRKLVMASSIAAVGFQSTRFQPLKLPIADEHPCLDRDGYGFSKYMMEEVTKYYHRQSSEIDVINLRLAAVCQDDRLPDPYTIGTIGPLQEWSLASITIIALSDAVRVFTLAAEAPYHPGVRIMNATGPLAWVRDPVAEVLRNWWGDDIDVSSFLRDGHERSSVYAVDRIAEQLGFEARILPQV